MSSLLSDYQLAASAIGLHLYSLPIPWSSRRLAYVVIVTLQDNHHDGHQTGLWMKYVALVCSCSSWRSNWRSRTLSIACVAERLPPTAVDGATTVRFVTIAQHQHDRYIVNLDSLGTTISVRPPLRRMV